MIQEKNRKNKNGGGSVMVKKLLALVALLVFMFSPGVYASEKCSGECKDRVNVKLYGYIKLDASYDTRQISTGNFARWVENTSAENSFLNITARQTRFGLNFSGPESESILTTGKVEFDFYGGGVENKNVPMMRHAFVKIWWKNLNIGLLAGQTSDVFSPLFPTTVNYTVLWWCGNIGYRRPQIRLSKVMNVGAVGLSLDAAAARAIGAESEGEPIIEYRAGMKVPFLAGKKADFGVSGHFGKDAPGKETASFNVDMSLPFGDLLLLKGEFWKGKNLSAYLGSIGQSFLSDVNGKGGWFAVTFGPVGSMKFNAGYGFDDPDDRDMQSVGGLRLKNSSFFGNVFYSVNRATVIAVEVSKWETQYLGGASRDALRGQFSVIYKF